MSTGSLERSLPSDWYHDDRIWRIEKERIFAREWLAVCREEELPPPGAGRVLDVLGESVIVVRHRSGAPRAFYNVCRHRGARLCRPDGEPLRPGRVALRGGVVSGRLILCPYHGWSYDFDGALVAAPHVGATAEFDRRDHGLYPVGLETWGGFVFLNLTPSQAQPLERQLGAMPARIARYPLAELRIGATRRYEVAANWKLLCENYNECYHCGTVHPELCEIVPAFRDGGGAALDWVRGVPHRPGANTFTRSGTTSRRPFGGLDQDELERHKGELAYPNMFLSLARDHVAAFILEPVAAERTLVTCHFLFAPAETARPDFDPSDAVDFWDLVNRQDWTVCEQVQLGIRARPHRSGVYAPMEDWNLDIRRYVTERIGVAAAAVVGDRD